MLKGSNNPLVATSRPAAKVARIAEFAKGDMIQGFFIVKTASIRTSNNSNSQFGDYTLADQTGEINAKLWEVRDPESCPKAGQVMKIQGLVNEYQDKLQLRIDRFRPLQEGDDIDPAALVPSAPVPGAVMYEQVLAYARGMSDRQLKALCLALLEDNRERLCVWPAAMHMHHSVRSGLLQHTLSMLRAAQALLGVYDYLRADLLYAGVILHDLAKLEEIGANDLGVGTGYTPTGALLGHITLGILAIARKGEALGLDTQTLTLVQHMLLSHHYEPDFGSPIRPMFPEAEVLHYLDVMDARLDAMRKALDGVPEGTLTERIFTLERRLYNPDSP